MTQGRIFVGIASEHILVTTDFDADASFRGIPTFTSSMPFGGRWQYKFVEAPVPALALRYVLASMTHDGMMLTFADEGIKSRLAELAGSLPRPHASLDEQSQRVIVQAPRIPLYQDMMRRLWASSRSDGSWSIPVNRVRDFIILEASLPKPARMIIDDIVLTNANELLPPPYDGTADSLRGMPLSLLHVVQGNIQSFSALKTNRSSIEDKFHMIGVNDLYDLIFYSPRKYINKTEPQYIQDLIPGESATVIGRIQGFKTFSKLLIISLTDSHGESIDCTFFNALWMQKKFKVDDEVIATGSYQIKDFHGHQYAQLAQPDFDFVDVDGVMGVIPVYNSPPRFGLSPNIIMYCTQELVSRLGDGFVGPSWSEELLHKHSIGSMSYGSALKSMHFPDNNASISQATEVLAFCELVQLMILIENERHGEGVIKGISQPSDLSLVKDYENVLPYALTHAQHHAVELLCSGMSADSRMHALLVGDVGSGKTTVMHMAALAAVNAGHQAVICAPTEILARQLYDTFMSILERMPAAASSRIHPVFHATYKGKGSAAKRRENIGNIENGDANVIFGTHAVLNLQYHDLTFVGVDEQHKFGASQRNRLLEIRDDGRVPDMLMQTATPIPRSMAQVYYGDISYIALDELPAGRQPIVTTWLKQKGQTVLDDADCELWSDIRRESSLGHGTFIVAPMVSDNDKIDAASVKKTYKRMQELMPDVNVGVVYGSQKKVEQDKVIEDFKNGTVNVLVASSVVEVGVSCDKATRMIVLDANRFGLASLHQIRGRIGRGSLPSRCYLVAMPFNVNAQRRLQSLVDTLDGWKLSKEDMKTRGTGSLFGTQQSGTTDLRFADLMLHAKWIGIAREDADSILSSSQRASSIKDAMRYFGTDEPILS
jgi:ATP-dependent DNA helicase RecG